MTTETIVVSTTICPVTEAAGVTQTASALPSATDSAGDHGHGNGGSGFTTSTIFTTRTATITACPSSVTNCPLRSKTTYLTTETLLVSTTVCPMADSTGSSSTTTTDHATSPSATEAIGYTGIGNSGLTTSTVWTTHTTTVTACPSSVTDCPLRSKTTYATTETLAVSTTVFPVSLAHTSLSAGGVNAATTTVNIVSPQVTNLASFFRQSSVTSFPNTPYYGSGGGGNRTVPASSTHLWPQSSVAGTMSTAVVSATRGAVDAVYTGAASAGTRWEMLHVAGTMMVILGATFF